VKKKTEVNTKRRKGGVQDEYSLKGQARGKGGLVLSFLMEMEKEKGEEKMPKTAEVECRDLDQVRKKQG